jgi:hypothetical protein
MRYFCQYVMDSRHALPDEQTLFAANGAIFRGYWFCRPAASAVRFGCRSPELCSPFQTICPLQTPGEPYNRRCRVRRPIPPCLCYSYRR